MKNENVKHDPELDLRQIIGEDKKTDVKALMEQARRDAEAGKQILPISNESVDEMIDRWILSGHIPSMTPGLAEMYRKRMKELQKEGKI